MSKAAFGAAERAVLTLFKPGEYFEYHGQRYRVKFSGKPTCSDGGQRRIYMYWRKMHMVIKRI